MSGANIRHVTIDELPADDQHWSLSELDMTATLDYGLILVYDDTFHPKIMLDFASVSCCEI
jgi:hypothetical protein